jgi:hypothetical protein
MESLCLQGSLRTRRCVVCEDFCATSTEERLCVHVCTQRLKWECASGRMQANYWGCISQVRGVLTGEARTHVCGVQVPAKGGWGGFKEKFDLVDANDLVVGG